MDTMDKINIAAVFRNVQSLLTDIFKNLFKTKDFYSKKDFLINKVDIQGLKYFLVCCVFIIALFFIQIGLDPTNKMMASGAVLQFKVFMIQVGVVFLSSRYLARLGDVQLFQVVNILFYVIGTSMIIFTVTFRIVLQDYIKTLFMQENQFQLISVVLLVFALIYMASILYKAMKYSLKASTKQAIGITVMSFIATGIINKII